MKLAGGWWLVVGVALLLGCGPRSRAPIVPLLERPTAIDPREGAAVDEARNLYRAGLYDQARNAANALTSSGSRHPDLLYLQALLAVQAGDHAGAVPWCEQAIAASPLWPEPRIQLAQSWLKLERYAAAESVFSDIERLAPHGPWGPYGVAAIAARRGDLQRATAQVELALERDPDHLPSLGLAAHLAKQAGQARREEELMARIVRLSPDEAGAWARLGELALAANRLEDARRAFERAYGYEARTGWAKALAELAQRRGDPAEAARWRRAAGQTTAPDRDLTPELPR
jgi:tetratricopeptide (TPR) repeat protein